MSKLILTTGFLALWIGMLFFCIPHDGHHIQHDLTTRSVDLLSKNGIGTGGLAVDGRFVTLTGYEGSPEVSDRAVQLVRGIWGVLSVRTNILPRPEPPKPVVTSVQAQEAAKTITTILKLRNVEFVSGTDELTAEGQKTLNQVAGVLEKYPGMQVEIAGHTDSRGEPSANMLLSRQRAAAVKKYLIGKGIAGQNLTDVGFGQTQPIATNETVAGRQLNRRVEFHTKETN